MQPGPAIPARTLPVECVRVVPCACGLSLRRAQPIPSPTGWQPTLDKLHASNPPTAPRTRLRERWRARCCSSRCSFRMTSGRLSGQREVESSAETIIKGEQEMKKIRSAKFSVSATIYAAVYAAMCIIVGIMMAATPARAQSAPATAAGTSATTVKIHGHAQDPLYQPITYSKVEITTDGKT